jgi:hypothetical protein
MTFNREKLEILSECIPCKMKEISSINPFKEALSIVVKSELDELQYLNSVVRDELSKLQTKSNYTE